MMPATEAAMVSALAPGKVAVTAMVGKSTRGSAETGSRRKPNTPKAIMEAVISVVITGRRMQSSDSVIVSRSSLAAALFHARAVRQQQLPVDHDSFAARKSFGDHRGALGRAFDLDRLDLCGTVLHHKHVVAALAALHGHRRHHHRILGADDQLSGHQRTRPQRLVV